MGKERVGGCAGRIWSDAWCFWCPRTQGSFPFSLLLKSSHSVFIWGSLQCRGCATHIGNVQETLAARGTTDSWKTAVLYQLVHAVALLALPENRAGTTVQLWTAGSILFSGSIYGGVLHSCAAC